MSSLLERIPPQNIDAEQAVLGSMLLDAEAISKTAALLKPEDFYNEAHQTIFRAILNLSEKNEPVDLVTITEELRQQGLLEKAGNIPYLITVGNAVPTAANVEYYAEIVGEKALLRQLIRVSTRIAQKGYEANEDAIRLVDEAEQAILEIAQRKARDGIVPLQEVLIKTLDHIEYLHNRKGDVTGVPTHYRELDRMTSGFQPSDLIIVAARPAMGKTALCLNIAENTAIKSGSKVAVFSLEMSREQLVQRMLSSVSLVDQHKLRTGTLTDQDWDAITRAVPQLHHAPIYIDDTPGINVMELRAKCRRLKAEKGLNLVIIDYLQLMQGSRRTDNRQQEVSEISRSLKALARELHIPVIALSQLSRSAEQSADKKPNLSHLRESGALEQDADMVMFIYRDEYYHPDTEKKGIAEIIIAKHRNGPVGSVEIGFLKEFTKFVNCDYR